LGLSEAYFASFEGSAWEATPSVSLGERCIPPASSRLSLG
jgi:hypothetical protein